MPSPTSATEPRAPISLEELLEQLQSADRITAEQAQDVAARERTLHSQVLKERFGSVRSQAALRYDVAPAEILTAARIPDRKDPGKRHSEDTVAEFIAEQAGLGSVKISPLEVDAKLVTKTFSRPFARRHAVIPLAETAEGGLRLAITDPHDSVLREDLAQQLRVPLELVVCSKRDILGIIDRVYGFQASVSGAEESLGEGGFGAGLAPFLELRSNEELAAAGDEHVVTAVDYLLNYAFEQRASDIHLEPREFDAVIRFRIDGILHEIERLPMNVHCAVVSRIKVLAYMDIAERRRPQDGRIKTFRAEREVELRVSSLLSAFGEKVVIRVFDPDVLMTDLQQLGFGRDDRESYERWITSPSGLILVTGPTGSGKTTTLYSTLRYLAGPEINITTVEDPIEMVDPRFCQVQVQRQADVTFANALRSILRQDPDIIMVGEIRDTETANMAVQAALTGHLVFSTVHTRDAAGAVTRLVELGVERFLLSSVLRGVVAQRLVRSICPHCGVEGFLSSNQVDALGLKVPLERREQLRVQWGEGCVDCRQTGLYGRSGVFEMLDVGRRVRGLINEGADANEITRAARVEGMQSLREAAIQKLAAGDTPFEEVVRLTADSE
ncbi:MAG: type II/IV secretion system protein [bacterium]|nr:type II/IV secretion system protein [bacterium]